MSVKTPVGTVVYIWDHLSGAATPPSGAFVRLTAGESGSGGYNQGLLGSESVSGSAPNVEATAQVLVGPMSGQTVRLVNTERSFLRGGSSGVFQTHQFQDHTHSMSFNQRGRTQDSRNSGVDSLRGGGGASFTVLDPTGARVGTETRPKNVGATAYLRIQ